jgi:uncharacterized membrane protein (DUF2068 family)
MASPTLPGTTKPRRFVPRFHYELLVCGLRGHALIGTDAAQLRAEDATVARQGADGTRWHRCLRCDSWLPLPAPEAPAREFPPDREDVEVPPRGRALRDKVVLRVIALDRAIHFAVLVIVAAAVFLFAANQASLRAPAYRVLEDLQSGLGGNPSHEHGLLFDVRKLFSVDNGTLTKIGIAALAYAVLEGAEAVGLWFQRRWAEYLTFIATGVLLIPEIYELANRLSPLKIVTFVLNLAVVVYLLLAKRLFGLRGGGKAEDAERERDSGWPAVDRATPGGAPAAAN